MKEKISKGFIQFIPVILFYSITVFLLRYDIYIFNQLNKITYFFLMPLLTALLLHKLYGNIYLFIGLGIGLLITVLDISFFGVFIAIFIVILLKDYVLTFNEDRMLFKILKGVIIIIITLIVLWVVSWPLLVLLNGLEILLKSLSNTNVVLFVGVLAIFSSIDLGGPLNKIAYAFTLTFYLEGAYHIVGPNLVAVSMPPFVMFFASLLMPKLFSEELNHHKKRTLVYASLGITEGAIPYVIYRPKIMLGVVVFSSVVASIVAALLALENTLLITSLLGVIGTNHIGYYILSHVSGIISGLLLLKVLSLKRLKVETAKI